MENIVVYSHQLRFEQVVEWVKEVLPKAKIDYQDGGLQKSLTAKLKGGLLGKDKVLKINYRQRQHPSYQLTEVSCGLTQNLAGMVNFIQSLPAKNEEVRQQLLIKVMSINCEMPFIGDPEIGSEFQLVLKKMMQELDAIAFAQPGKPFNKSYLQHFLDKDLNLILDTAGSTEIDQLEVTVDAKYHDSPADDYTEEQLERKARSEALLETQRIKVNKNLPCILSSEALRLRSKEEVIERVYALLITAAKGEGIEQEQLKKVIDSKNIKGFSPRERSILSQVELNDQERAYASWRYESLNLLLWALHQIDALNPAQDICKVQEVVGIIIQPDRTSFESGANLRNETEILDQLDLTYRMHWACVDARINNHPVGGGLNPSVVYERHYALNWLTHFQNQEWDDIQTPT